MITYGSMYNGCKFSFPRDKLFNYKHKKISITTIEYTFDAKIGISCGEGNYQVTCSFTFQSSWNGKIEPVGFDTVQCSPNHRG